MKNFRLLVTKKISPSLVLQAGLKGVDILEKEFIRIVPVVNDQLNKKIIRLATEEHTVVFTSKNAVSSIAAINTFVTADWKIFCIDGATKDEVKKYIPAGNIEGTAQNASLLAKVIAEKSENRKIIFFCGNKRIEDLPGFLLTRNFDVEELVVYNTELVPQKIIDDFDAVAFFSPTAAESFFSVNNLKETVVCFSVGRTTTEAIIKYTENEVITAVKPSEETIIELAIKQSKY
ncbi:MAG TPA: uroporphyrinogen-III synthase [Flavitalea sp.]|nr:uroporphyrinogen-III synthase [Flavitalea sp.]